MAVQSHGIVVERGDVGLAARQAGSHVADTTVGTHAMVSMDVRGIRHRLLQGSHTHKHRHTAWNLKLDKGRFTSSSLSFSII